MYCNVWCANCLFLRIYKQKSHFEEEKAKFVQYVYIYIFAMPLDLCAPPKDGQKYVIKRNPLNVHAGIGLCENLDFKF